MIVQHYKGGFYYVHDVYESGGLKLIFGNENLQVEEEYKFIHTETGRVIVIKETEGVLHNTDEEEDLTYYEDMKGNLWARPIDMFNGTVILKDKPVRRFQSIGEYDFFKMMSGKPNS